MIAGFKSINAKMSTGTPLPQAFTEAFPKYEYKSSTYGENHKAYTAALDSPGEIEAWEALGHTSEGLWRDFRRKWKDLSRK